MWKYLQHDLLVKEERDDCAVIATRLAAIMSGVVCKESEEGSSCGVV